MIPFELITGGVSLLAGIAAQFLSNAQKAKQENQHHLLRMAGLQEESRLRAMRMPSGGPWVRRAIACAVFGYLFVAPWLMPVLGIDIPIYFPYWEDTGGWKVFGGGMAKLKLIEMRGIVFTPFHLNVGTMIACFYFGQGAMKQR